MMLSHLSFYLTIITISFPFTIGDTFPSLSYGMYGGTPSPLKGQDHVKH